jgi:hypothetical protein
MLTFSLTHPPASHPLFAVLTFFTAIHGKQRFKTNQPNRTE